MDRPSRYIDVDKLQSRTSLEEAAAMCGVRLDVKGAGGERRIDCPFGCVGDHAGRKEVAINVENPQKVFQCHAYGCGFRGNLLMLMHAWTTGQKPTGGKLKGEEFQRIKKILAARESNTKRLMQTADPKSAEPASGTPPSAPKNIALVDSPDPKIRELHNIDAKFVVDVAAMNPAAAAYVRRHPCLVPEAMRKWRCGYLPNDGGGDKRGWSLRGSMVYAVLSETGKVLCWVARDLHYEQKEIEFAALTAAERAGKEPPAKHRFPKGFHRGNELYGQHASRLNEPSYREFIAKHGLIAVEGFNDVINLDNLGIPAVGIMSNRITESQVEKIVRWARQLSNNRVSLMLDNDSPGVEGAKEAMWLLAERSVDVRLVWSPSMFGGKFERKQPESVKLEDWEILTARRN